MISLIGGIFRTYLQNRNGMTDVENKLMVTGGKENGLGLTYTHDYI